MSEGLAPILHEADREVPERDNATNLKNARNGKAKDVTTAERTSFEPALGDKHAILLLVRVNPTLRRPPTDGGRPVVTTMCFPTRDALLALLTADPLRPSAASRALFWRHAGQTTSKGQAADSDGEYFCLLRYGGAGASTGIFIAATPFANLRESARTRTYGQINR